MALPKSFGIGYNWPAGGGVGNYPLRAPVAGDVMIGGSRPQWPTAPSSVAAAGTGKQLSDTYFSAPPWAGNTIYLALPAFYVSGGNERPIGNDVPIGYVTLFRGNGTAVPILVVADNYVIKNMTGRWLKCVCPFNANEDFRARIELNMPVGARWPLGMYLNMAGSDLGEGRESGSTTSNEAKRLTGALTVGLGNAQAYGPSMVAFDNWDGTTEVSLGWGDSRLVPQNDHRTDKSFRGALGAVGKACTSVNGKTGRHAYASISISGAYAKFVPRDAGVRLRMMRAWGNRPFTQVWTTNYGNDLNGPSTPPTLEEAKAGLYTMANFFASRYPGVMVKHVVGYPWASDTNLTRATTLEGQLPSVAAQKGNVQDQYEDWVLHGVGVPSNIKAVSVRSAMSDPRDSHKWGVNPAVGHFKELTSSRVRLVVFPEPIPKGANVIIGSGLATVESFTASNVTIVAPNEYSIACAEAQLQVHTANADPALADSVRLSDTRDLVHPGAIPNERAVPLLEAVK